MSLFAFAQPKLCHIFFLQEESVDSQGFGLIFRENKFACDPILPFNAMAMPSFNLLNNPGAKVEVDNNHFVCNCDKTNW